MRIPSVLSSSSHPLGQLFYRYYWLQIALIAFAVVIGIGGSAFIVKGLLLKTALQQEMAHYWQRVDKNPNANLPDTKNLYGYRWNTTQPPDYLQHLSLQTGVHRIPIDGKERMTVYEQRQDQHVLLVFGESNVNRLVWLFGLAPLMFSLFVFVMNDFLFAIHIQDFSLGNNLNAFFDRFDEFDHGLEIRIRPKMFYLSLLHMKIVF